MADVGRPGFLKLRTRTQPDGSTLLVGKDVTPACVVAGTDPGGGIQRLNKKMRAVMREFRADVAAGRARSGVGNETVWDKLPSFSVAAEEMAGIPDSLDEGACHHVLEDLGFVRPPDKGQSTAYVLAVDLTGPVAFYRPSMDTDERIYTVLLQEWLINCVELEPRSVRAAFARALSLS